MEATSALNWSSSGGELLGLEASEALRVAHATGLIPSVHPPRKSEKPR